MNLGRARRWTQAGVVLALLGLPLLNQLGVDRVQGTLCSVGTSEASLTCPLGALQVALATRSVTPGLVASALPWVLLALVLGRVFCGWVCPQHLASEAGDAVRTRLGRNRLRAPDSPARARAGRALLLAILGLGLVGTFALGVPLICAICPVGVLCRAAVNLTWAGRLGGELVVVAVILVAEVGLARRGWCKYICPLGAFTSLCATRLSLRPVRNDARCVHCHSCERDCPMGNSPLEGRIGPTCTNCARCVEVCPGSALRFGIGRARPAGPRRLPLVG